MAEKKIKFKLIGRYNGHNAKPNKAFTTGFTFGYDQLKDSVQCLQLLNENVEVVVKIADGKPLPLGMFMIEGYNVNRDGEATVKLNTTLDYVEEGNFTDLAKELITVMFRASINIEEEGDLDE